MKTSVKTKKLTLNKMTLTILNNPESIKGGSQDAGYSTQTSTANFSTQTATNYGENTGW